MHVYEAQVEPAMVSWYAFPGKEATSMNSYITGTAIKQLREHRSMILGGHWPHGDHLGCGG